MNPSLARACLALHRNPKLSSRQFNLLLSCLESPEQALDITVTEMVALGLPTSIQAALGKNWAGSLQLQLERDWSLLQTLEIELLTLSCNEYPAPLKEITDPPPLLYLRGNKDLLNTPQLAMVGSRRCTAQGRENARQFAGQLASAGFTITSGLALGIDAESHRGALDVGGNTLAVLGTGIDRVYPQRNRVLFECLLERGALVSGFPLGAEPRRGNFPVRNRLVSGMSLGVLVVEGAPQSGSLITARYALEQGREVFAIPGSIHHPGSRGCHHLIRQGAKLVETTGHILEEFSGWLGAPSVPEPADPVALTREEAGILQHLGYDPVSIDRLQQRCERPVASLLSILTALELKGVVESQGGCFQRLAISPVK